VNVRLANVGDRAVVLTSAGGVDVERHSASRFPADLTALYPHWDELREWAATIPDDAGDPVDESLLGPPSPRPRQVFAVGLNYAPHAAEAGFARPTDPLVFTKFQSCIAGPTSPVPIPSGCVDWEVELVVVIGRTARRVDAAQAWSHVAGLTIGQDFSEREVQGRGQAPQYSLGKSFAKFGPIGPYLVTVDELADPDDLAIECAIDDELVQSSRTKDLLFPVSELIAYLSAVCTLYPGDLLFTGTPDGTGAGRTPPRFLKTGETVVSRIEGLGTMRNPCVPADVAAIL
jgi:2-keto-4-pentenoate hydratase/2-oxohepta-3-ene-1,7-dioic acid hydratase in catechol pathway